MCYPVEPVYRQNAVHETTATVDIKNDHGEGK